LRDIGFGMTQKGSDRDDYSGNAADRHASKKYRPLRRNQKNRDATGKYANARCCAAMNGRDAFLHDGGYRHQ
jgi:hypothetical protein